MDQSLSMVPRVFESHPFANARTEDEPSRQQPRGEGPGRAGWGPCRECRGEGRVGSVAVLGAARGAPCSPLVNRIAAHAVALVLPPRRSRLVRAEPSARRPRRRSAAGRRSCAGRDTLIAAPTGSGKTLAAFLASLDALVHAGPTRGELGDAHRRRLRLAAQGAEQRRPEEPRGAARRASATRRPSSGSRPPRSARRSAPATRRRRRAPRSCGAPPHVLITTPESLYLMLTAERTRALLRGVRTVIVDELHALMRDKRGSHLALSLARLDALAERAPAAHRAVGDGAPDRGGRALPRRARPALRDRRRRPPARPRPRDRAARHRPRRPSRRTSSGARSTTASPRSSASTGRRSSSSTRGAWPSASPTTSASASARTASARTTAASPRSGACASSSASRPARCAPSSRRRRSSSASTSARSTSSARSARRARSRRSCSASAARGTRSAAPRAGASSRPRATSSSSARRWCARWRRATLDRVEPPVRAARRPGAADRRRVRGARVDARTRSSRSSVRRRPFASLTRADFDDVVASARRGRGAAARPRRRAPAPRPRQRRRCAGGGRRASSRSPTAARSPTSPTTASCSIPTRRSSARSTRTGRSRAWRATSSSSARTRGASGASSRGAASCASRTRGGQPPTVPFWLGEAPARTVGAVGRGQPPARRRRRRGCDARDGRPRLARDASARSSPRARTQIVDYVAAQRDALGVVPTIGRRRLRALLRRGGRDAARRARAVRRADQPRLRPRAAQALLRHFDFELQAAATDDAIVLSLGHGAQLPARRRVPLRPLRASSTRRSSRRSWPRRCSARAGAGTRRARSRSCGTSEARRCRRSSSACAPTTCSPPCSRRRSPARRTRRRPDRDPRPSARPPDGATTASSRRWTSTRLRGVLAADRAGRDPAARARHDRAVAVLARDPEREAVRLPRRRAARGAPRRAPCRCGGRCPSTSATSARSTRRPSRASWPRRGPQPRDADELHDVLLGLVAAPIERGVARLARRARARRARGGGRTAAGALRVRRRARERRSRRSTRALRRAATRLPRSPRRLGGPRARTPSSRSCGGTPRSSGPSPAASLASAARRSRSGRSRRPSRGSRAEGVVLRGRFTPGVEEEEACDRRLLARIHRYTLDRLRSEIEPVSAQDFLRYLFERHHLTPRTRPAGARVCGTPSRCSRASRSPRRRGSRTSSRARVAGYRAEWLDELCLAGEVAWGRLSPRRATTASIGVDLAGDADHARASAATSAGCSTPCAGEAPEPPTSDAARAVLEALRRRGALFLDDLAAAAQPRGGGARRLRSGIWSGAGWSRATAFNRCATSWRPAGASRRRARAVQGRWSLLERLEPRDASGRRAGRPRRRAAPRALRRRLPRGRRPARASPSRGATSSGRSAAARRAASCAEGASSPGSSVSNTRCPKRSTPCGECAARSARGDGPHSRGRSR